MIIVALSAFIASCSSDQDEPGTTDEKGKLSLKFDNSFNGNDLILETQTNTTAHNEKLKVNVVRYIVSNIVLTKSDGTIFTYPKSKSYFIADENDPATGYQFDLSEIPAGDYTKVKFGIGVDKEQWQLGAAGQGDFLAKAQAKDLLWSWSAGYKYLAFEGTFTSETVTSPASFMIHTGQIGGAYNYTEVTLDLPVKALVRSNITPSIHIVTDLSKILDGENTIKLSDYNEVGMGAMIMGGEALPKMTTNISKMFRIDHVHNN